MQYAPVFTKKLPPPPFVEPDPAVYSQNSFYSGKLVEIGNTGNKDGYNLVTLNYYPIQYNPVTGDLEVYNNIEVEIINERGVKAVNSIFPHMNAFVKRGVKDLIANKDDIDVFAPPFKKTLPDSLVEYAIIVDTSDINCADHPEIRQAMEPLAYWKTKKGILTKIYTLDYIEANFTGTTIPDKIKNFINYAHTNWGTMWFLLVDEDDSDADYTGYGTSESDVGTWMPRHDLYVGSSGAGYYTDEDTIASDHWYADLNNELYTDVYLTRVLFDEAAKAYAAYTLMVHNTLTYEKNPPAGYVEKMLLTSENLFTGYDGTYVSDSIANNDPASFFDAKCYDELGRYDDIATVDSLNVGYGYHYAAGHGDEIGYMYGSNDPIQVNDIENYLATGDRLYIFWAISCWPGAYDYDSYAEHLMTLPSHGAVAFMLNYRYGWGTLSSSGRSEWQSIWFTKAVFQEGYTHFVSARARMNDRCVPYTSSDWIVEWCIREYNGYGEPELPLWTAEPKSLTASHPSTVFPGGQSVTVTVRDASTSSAINGAVVCLMTSDQSVYAVDTTDATGSVSITINPANGDTIWVTATAYDQNYKPYEGYMVCVGDGVYFNGITYLDTVSGGTIVQDGNINPGETCDLSIQVKNTKSTSVTNAVGRIYITDSRVTVIDDNHSYGNIASGATEDGLYRISVSNPGYGFSHPCTLVVTYTDGMDTSVFDIQAVGVGVASSHTADGGSELVYNYTETKGIKIKYEGTAPVLKKYGIIEPSGVEVFKLNDPVYSTKAYYATIQYDDGTVYYHWSGVDYWAVRFTPAARCSVVGVFWGRYHERSETDTVWLKSDNAGSPGTVLDGFYSTVSNTYTNVLYYASFPNGADVNGDFWICIYARSDNFGSNESYFLGDSTDDGNDGLRSYYSSDNSSWTNMNSAGHISDFFIRAEVYYFDLYMDADTIWVLNTDPNTSSDFNVTDVYVKHGSSWITTLTPKTGVVPVGDSLGITVGIDTTGLDRTQNYYDTVVVVTTAGTATKAANLEVPVSILFVPLQLCEVSGPSLQPEVNRISLVWIATSGLHDHWEVYRKSRDNYEKVGFIPASQKGQYACVDRNVKPDVVYSYRIAYVSTSGEKRWFGTAKGKINAMPYLTLNLGNILITGKVTIQFLLPVDGHATLTVFDRSGRMVNTLLNEDAVAGFYNLQWDGKDKNGRPLPSGIYFVKLTQGSLEFTRRIILVR